jgi:regulator of replication initiation timing
MDVEEEIALLEEQLADAHAELEGLREQLAAEASRASGAESEADGLRQRLSAAEAALGEREQALASMTTEAEGLRTAAEEAHASAREAAARYREVLLASEPSLPPELVGGESVAEVDAAAESARATVAQVRQHLEQQAQALRVPAGAPTRGAPDFGAMTPAEKIRLGLEER